MISRYLDSQSKEVILPQSYIKEEFRIKFVDFTARQR